MTTAADRLSTESTRRPLDRGIADSYLLNVGMIVRPAGAEDRAQWEPLWAGYNLFYDRPDLPSEITEACWTRFLDPDEQMYAAVAELDGELVGLVHYLFHRSTTSIADVCYLQDLFTAPAARRAGFGRALIEHVYSEAAKAGSSRVYWQTHEANPARSLYDQVAQLTAFRRYVKELE